MAVTIKLKNASGSDPSASDLVLGELAVRTDNGKIFLKKDNGSVAEVSGGGGIDDGDKGDITVSNSGDTWTIDNDAVTYAKIQNVSATDRLLGRDSSGAGVIEEISPSSVRTMLGLATSATTDTTNADNIGSGTLAAARVATLNQDTTGSAATLTTARTIAGTSFDGSANIDISYANLTNKLSVGDGGLTQNNFTNTLKSKLDGIASSATNVTNNNQLTNGAGYITSSNAAITNKLPLAGGTLTGNVIHNDNVISYFGSDNDLSMHHTGSTGYVKNTTGTLYIQDDSSVIIGKVTDSHTGMKFIGGDALELYHDNNLRFATSNDGATLTGRLTPAANNTYGLGSSSLRWANFYSVAGNFSGTLTANAFSGNITGNVTGNTSGSAGSCTGNAATATTLATARTIAGVSFDGSANISLNNNAITNGAGYITATLTEEQVEDYVGGMVTGNTETGITVTYQDADGTLDFVVASQTDNNFTDTLKNKLDGIAASATNVTNNNQLTNGASYVTSSIINSLNASNLDSGTVGTARLGSGTASSSTYLRGDGSWATISAGAEDGIFWENDQAVSSNYTITNGKNAMSAGPITINSGVTVTVGSGENWTIV